LTQLSLLNPKTINHDIVCSIVLNNYTLDAKSGC
jgi:hypothetical protein